LLRTVFVVENLFIIFPLID